MIDPRGRDGQFRLGLFFVVFRMATISRNGGPSPPLGRYPRRTSRIRLVAPKEEEMLTHLRSLFVLLSMVWQTNPPVQNLPVDPPKFKWTEEQRRKWGIAAKEARNATD